MRMWFLPGLLLLAMSCASSQGMLILTSEDAVDMSLAKVLSGATGATVVTAQRGFYDEPLVQRIVALRPEKVAIIGNASAVGSQMESALRKHGISVVRTGGVSDMEKSLNLFSQYRSAFVPKGVVCIGKDALPRAVPYAAQRKYPLFITDARNLRSLLSALKGAGVKEYVLFSTNKQGDLKGEASQKMESAKTLMKTAEQKIVLLEEKDLDTTAYHAHLAACRTTFSTAQKAYEGGDILRALLFLDESLMCLAELDNSLNEALKSLGGSLL